jgi:hypothetical protein
MKESMDMPLNLVFIGEDVNWADVSKQLAVLEN